MGAALILTVVAAQWLALAAIMAAAWGLEQRTGNSGYVDVIWSIGVGLTGALFAILPLPVDMEDANIWRPALVAIMAAAWGLRLGLHILTRSRSRADDPRYAAMKRAWGPDAPREMFFLLQKQAIVAVPLVFAVFLAARNTSPAFSLQDALAVCVFLVAIMGEAVADRQLRAFVSNPANRGKICDAGLWSASRHPNYFFEWLHWLAYPVAAFDGNLLPAVLALGAPLVMYWLLVYVSGIPPLEEHMLNKHGDRYRAYQARTNAFFPGPAKHV